ncbi:MAG: hypothetical protein JO038_03570 [Alphaproteobacteria bacterium]|nr:hypothetical protein [Alphaproteobacteria bacterium]
MAKAQSPAQKKTVERVMHEFKHGELKTAAGKRKVKNPKQAIAIALHEAGASKYEDNKTNQRNLRRTKAKEQRGQTGKEAAEGRGTKKSARGGNGGETTRAALYEEAKKRGIPGRSKMNKAELERALHK